MVEERIAEQFQKTNTPVKVRSRNAGVGSTRRSYIPSVVFLYDGQTDTFYGIKASDYQKKTGRKFRLYKRPQSSVIICAESVISEIFVRDQLH